MLRNLYTSDIMKDWEQPRKLFKILSDQCNKTKLLKAISNATSSSRNTDTSSRTGQCKENISLLYDTYEFGSSVYVLIRIIRVCAWPILAIAINNRENILVEKIIYQCM